MLFGNDRRQLRQFFFSAWRKHRHDESLEGAERLVVAVALRHPEYHALLDNPDASADRDWLPELGESNPFLHMAMHIAIEEQLGVDRPPGIRAHYATLCRNAGDDHAAQHQVMECLAETLWQAGRHGQPPDERAYLDCLQRAAASAPHPSARS
jgi:hypothetical protein